MGALSPIPVRQSMNRCRLLLPITGVTSVQSQSPWPFYSTIAHRRRWASRWMS